MITLALDTATDRCSVAVSDGRNVAATHLDGSRRHAAAIIGMIDEVLTRIGATSTQITRVITSDGPGSFTGLRVAASIAKALVWQRPVQWLTAPSLLVRAAGHVPARGGVVLALSDALRGELYAGCWKFSAADVERVGPSPRAFTPDALVTFGAIDRAVGSIPPALIDAVRGATKCDPIVGEPALPEAAQLLSLPADALRLVEDPVAWQPEYGRPAEAQVVWERNHGMELPAASGIAR